jgi:hypothetical protein
VTPSRRSHDSVNLRSDLCVGRLIKIDTLCCAISLKNNSRNDVFATALHAKASAAPRFAQTSGEIRDVLAKARAALQHFVPACVFSAILSQSIRFRCSCVKSLMPVGYFFSMKMTAIVYRTYMPGLVMLSC